MEKESKEFKEQKKLIALKKKAKLESAELLHKLHMKELEFIRESERIKHEKELERHRIKSADIRRSQERKQNLNFMNSYHKNNS